jgi:hypothetical protein
MKKIDLCGFNFHIFPDKSYVVVDPQSDAEDRRLNDLVDANAICREVFKQQLAKAKPNTIHFLIEPRQVGWTPQNEVVLVVVEGACALLSDAKSRVNGHWYVVRVPESGFEELKADLGAAMEDHRRKISSDPSASEWSVGTVERELE